MQYLYEDWLDVMRSESVFLKSVGIEPCVIDDPCPGPLPLLYPERPRVRLTEMDARWLRACGVAWEPEPAVQLPLDFCSCRKKERDQKAPARQAKEKSV
jgi:hypothetical protein